MQWMGLTSLICHQVVTRDESATETDRALPTTASLAQIDNTPRPCKTECEWDSRVLNMAGANPQADWFAVPDVVFWRKRSNEVYAAVAPSLPRPRQVGKVWRTLLFSH